MDSNVDKPIFAALVAVDDSARARNVVTCAAAYVKALQGTLVLYRGIVVPPDYAPAGMHEHIDVSALPTQKALNDLNVLRGFVPDVSCELIVEPVIDPWKGILATADAIKADLIVVGSHGYSGWDHVLGTTAGKVANHSRRNVLVVHDDSQSTSPGT